MRQKNKEKRFEGWWDVHTIAGFENKRKGPQNKESCIASLETRLQSYKCQELNSAKNSKKRIVPWSSREECSPAVTLISAQ